MKLSKPAIKAHEQALDLLKKDVLSYEDKLFVFQHWTPMYSHQVNKAGVFFTPADMANTFCLEVVGPKIIDLCAGIGMLSFTYYHWCPWNEKPSITCVEINPDFVEVGKKLLPEANWICGSAIDVELLRSLGRFNGVISNPPFGKIAKQKGVLNYTGSEFEYMVIEAGKEVAEHGTFIIPQMSCPFKYSGEQGFQKQSNDKHTKFLQQTGIVLSMNCGIDCNTWKDEWNGASPVVEIASVDYRQLPVVEEVNIDEPKSTRKTKIINDVLIDAPGEEYDGESMAEVVELKPVVKGISWIDLFGKTDEVYSEAERQARWEEWKALAQADEQGREMIEYWQTVVLEGCKGCKHLQGEWCKAVGLPGAYNPVLKETGMACLGVGHEPIDNQLTLQFD